MNILAISDTESRYLWDDFSKEKLAKVDLILSCGDLSPLYLSFLATFFHGPILYVHGNHDGVYEVSPPYGCICVEDQIYVHQGIRILGLGGSMRYKEGPHQYTQAQMNHRIRRLWFSLKRHKGFDILLTHAPAYHLNDEENLPHQGFQGFLKLMERYEPSYFVHGHVHLTYNYRAPRTCSYEKTTVVNAYERALFEFPNPLERSI
ncbi:MAG: metallophosphoesterase [Lachnospiraceae bacterium]|nr:metallophosphoesterase [Lachnospiraceae bacterium]